MVQRRLNFQHIRQRLAEMNLAVDDFKRRVGCHGRTVERLMSGKTKQAQYRTVKAMADFLELEPQDILVIASDDVAQSLSAQRPIPDLEVYLPVTSAHLVGRAQELEQLDRAWSCGQTTIFSIVAWGGVGKSALVNHWLGKLAHDGWRGAERVFGWTFYSQGVRDTVASADVFINAALRFFGDPEPGVGTPWDKGNRLARFVREKRTLLVLDGLEPLQYPPVQYPPGPEAGKLKDPALAACLKTLALHNPGLCIITTRIAVADLASFQPTTTEVFYLDDLQEEAGAELLRTLGVRSSDAERRAASRELHGHALALHLLGTYVRDACGGDVSRRREMARLDDWSEQGGHAWRIMESYERWFGHGPEVAVLRLLGLFDRVAQAHEIAALRAKPRILELNDTLIGLQERQWLRALRRLRTAGLLAPPDPQAPHALDAHPLVREYYRHKLREHHPAAWRAGHARLYRHLQETVLEECPHTIEALSPLYAAVIHGCLAGRAYEALHVFQRQIRHGEHNFSIAQLGAFGADLVALASFFDVMWTKVVSGLHPDDHLFLSQAAGECLSALGRVFEAEEALRQALALAHRQENWTIAAIAATKLGEVYRAQGDLATALRLARQSAAYVSRPGVPPQIQLLSHVFLGFALYWMGQSKEATTTFQYAEQVQQLANPERLILHSVLGYMYCELLLDHLDSQASHLTPTQFEQAWRGLHRRVMQALAFAEQDRLPCDMGLQHVSMGRVYVLAWQHHVADDVAGSLASEQALMHLTRAVEYLRLSNHRNYLPRGLLTRAALYRLQGHFTLAHDDLTEALDIAQNSAMHFYQADVYLEAAALHLATSQTSPGEDHVRHAVVSLDKAKTLIHTMAYYRRNRQVAELEAILKRVALP